MPHIQLLPINLGIVNQIKVHNSRSRNVIVTNVAEKKGAHIGTHTHNLFIPLAIASSHKSWSLCTINRFLDCVGGHTSTLVSNSPKHQQLHLQKSKCPSIQSVPVFFICVPVSIRNIFSPFIALQSSRLMKRSMVLMFSSHDGHLLTAARVVRVGCCEASFGPVVLDNRAFYQH